MKNIKILGLLAVVSFSLAFITAPALASCKEAPGECVETAEDCGDHAMNTSDCLWMKSYNEGCPLGLGESNCTDTGGSFTVIDGVPFCYWESKPSKLISNGTDSCDPATAWCSCGNCLKGTIPDPSDPNCENEDLSIGVVINRFIPLLPVVVGLVLLAMIVVGGIKIATAGENEEQKKKGIQTIINAGIGVGIVVGAIIIISILEAILKVQILYGFRL